jgi:tetratricopeptide (TPR) repeat protein
MSYMATIQRDQIFLFARCTFGLLFATLVLQVSSVRAQASVAADQDRKAAIALYQQNRFEEALPLLENLILVYPDDLVLLEEVGTCLNSHAIGLSDPEARRQTRLRARKFFVHARDLGDNSNYLQSALEGIPEDGSMTPYSNRAEVDSAMRSAEAAFGRGDFPGALAGYATVAQLDPTNNEAALFSGDVYFKQKDYDNSYIWFAKAVAIDPDRETAYRYWGDALDAAGKHVEAREKYIEAIVASPYQRIARTGLTQWADRNKLTLTQPQIDSPDAPSTNGNNTNITIDASTLGKKDGTENWMLYSITRASWRGDEFKKHFPNEKEYRHSLDEESAALGMVADAVSKKVKQRELNPQIATLIKLKNEGLLESYILLSRPDQGIAQDYADYRKDHRDKLIQYMNEYVVPAAK